MTKYVNTIIIDITGKVRFSVEDHGETEMPDLTGYLTESVSDENKIFTFSSESNANIVAKSNSKYIRVHDCRRVSLYVTGEYGQEVLRFVFCLEFSDYRTGCYLAESIEIILESDIDDDPILLSFNKLMLRNSNQPEWALADHFMNLLHGTI